MKEKVISMAKKESQDGKSKKGLPRLMELAIYFIIQEIVGAYPDFSTLDVPKVLGYGGLALGGVLLNVLLCTASVELSHIAASVSMQNQLCFPHYKAPTGLPFEDGQR